MIYDCFTLRDELDLLEIRLKILDPYVDKFIISEANKTHTNLPKEYNFHLNRERFTPWLDKITYLPVKLDDTGLDFSKKDTTYTPTSPSWVFENQQRNALSYGLKNLKEDDIVMIGDLDEIPNMNNLPKEFHGNHMFIQKFFYYYFNNKSMGPRDALWAGTVVTTGKHFTTPQDLRDKRNGGFPIREGGWHLSYMGGKEMIKKKIQTIAHTEFNKPQFYSDENIDKCLTEGKDVFDREGMNFSIVKLENEYPKRILDILTNYKDFIYYVN